jgi:hypothetical protein
MISEALWPFCREKTGHLLPGSISSLGGLCIAKELPLEAIEFGAIPVGAWFKESQDGAWHLKSSCSTGMYQHFGTRYEPSFQAGETVFVDCRK